MSERWKEYFDKNSAFDPNWLRSAVPHWGFHESLYGNILKYCPPPARILDVGCGPGWSAIYLASLGYEVVGIDNEQSLVDLANENARRLSSKATFVRGDAFNLSELGLQFDLAYSSGVLEHFDREVTINLLMEQAKCAKQVLIQIPTRFTAYTGEVTDERFYSINELKQIVRESGLEILKAFGYGELNATRLHLFLRQILPRAAWRVLQNMGYGYAIAVIGSGTNTERSTESL